jgi:hypothetical protein
MHEVGPVQLLHCSHMFGGTILRYDFQEEYGDFLDVLSNVELPLRESLPFRTSRPSTPKRQKRKIGGQTEYAFPIDQGPLNLELDQQLRDRNWTTQPIAGIEPATAGIRGPRLKGDFVKNGIFVEIEFGNVASMYRDLLKFHVASRARAGQVGILVTATQRLAKFFDQGVATFESAYATLP